MLIEICHVRRSRNGRYVSSNRKATAHVAIIL